MHVKSGESSYVPHDFVKILDNFEGQELVLTIRNDQAIPKFLSSLTGNFSWFHGNIDRKLAENLVLHDRQPPGSFLIRQRQDPNEGEIIETYGLGSLFDKYF